MMSFSPPTPPMSLKPRNTKNSARLSPLSWAQYLAMSPQTSSTNNKTELQRMKRMQRLFRSWRDDQIARAHQRRSSWFVSHPPVTSPMCSAAMTQNMTTATEPTLKGCPRQVPTLSLCNLRVLQDTPWGPSMEFRQLAHRGRSRSMGTLSTPQDISTGTMSTQDKENDEDASQVSQVCQVAKGMGYSRGKRRGGGRGVAEAETGPILLYHHWSAHSVGVQAVPHPLSPIPSGFEMNRGPQYVPFHIVNRDGVTVPAKYIKVKMTNDPYAYGMLNSTGEVYKGVIHTAPMLDITHVPRLSAEDLTSLRFDYVDVSCINNALA